MNNWYLLILCFLSLCILGTFISFTITYSNYLASFTQTCCRIPGYPLLHHTVDRIQSSSRYLSTYLRSLLTFLLLFLTFFNSISFFCASMLPFFLSIPMYVRFILLYAIRFG